VKALFAAFPQEMLFFSREKEGARKFLKGVGNFFQKVSHTLKHALGLIKTFNCKKNVNFSSFSCGGRANMI